MAYKIIYSFEVVEKIKEGYGVFLLDRKKEAVECVNDMEVGDFAKVLTLCQEEKTRFEFWINDNVEEKNT